METYLNPLMRDHRARVNTYYDLGSAIFGMIAFVMFCVLAWLELTQ